MLNIKNKIEFDKCFVGLIDNNFNKGAISRSEVAHLSNVTKGGLESKSPMLRFNSFLTESAGKPSVPLEFIPVILTESQLNSVITITNPKLSTVEETHNNLMRYTICKSKINSDGASFIFQTNLRVLLNCGIDLSEIPFNTNEEIKDFKIIIAKLPYFVWMHLRTHRAFSFMIETGRKSKMCEEFYETTDKNYQNKPELLRLRLGCFAGWLNDNNSFKNLFDVRQTKYTQIDTFKVVENIKIIML